MELIFKEGDADIFNQPVGDCRTCGKITTNIINCIVSAGKDACSVYVQCVLCIIYNYIYIYIYIYIYTYIYN